jgi:DNA-binding GntR family transcriptional regulator
MGFDRGKAGMTALTAGSDGGAEGLIGSVSRGSTLTDKVYEKLRQALLSGVWEPGQKITARSLSRDMEVSLTPVREAMMKLANEGALEISETRAFLVPLLSRAKYEEVTGIRMALEPLATEAAMPFITPKVIDRLEELNEHLKALIEDEQYNEALQTDSQFHHTIYTHADQEVLKSMIDALWLRVGPTRTLLSHTFRKRLVGYTNHKSIIAALRSGDVQAARAAVHHDISVGAQSLCKALKD